MINITKHEYSGLEQAYRFFDERLFGGVLPDCLIVLHRKANAKGYFAGERYENRDTGEKTDEVALNPDSFIGRSDMQILGTLVHEQAHLWQFHYGVRPTQAYHDTQWAEKMESIGLMPTSTGDPGGKRTGRRVTHYIIPGGLFETAANELFGTGYKINWQSPAGSAKEKPKSKVKYTCPSCTQNAWAKPKTKLICGDCHFAMISE